MVSSIAARSDAWSDATNWLAPIEAAPVSEGRSGEIMLPGAVIAQDQAIETRTSDWTADWLAGRDFGYSSPSVTGVEINQHTAMQCVSVMACVSMISEDIAKLTPSVFRRQDDGGRVEEKGHFLYDLLDQPNDWQTWYEFCQMMNIGLLLRGNAYAVIVRDWRGNPSFLVPINPDKVALWEAPDGSIFFMVTRTGLHELAVLRDQPLLIPYRDILHLKGASGNGLLGFSRIAMAREAVALAIAQEQQAVRWMGNGAKPSGILTTENKLTPDAVKRMAQDWRDAHAGLQNSGKVAVLEQGLKWQALSMSASDMEFIASRTFQLQEIARMFRIPPHMIGELSRSTNNNITQHSQEYANYTLSTYTKIWTSRLAKTFGMSRRSGLHVDFDMRILLEADLGQRINMHRQAVLGGLETQNEGRLAIGLNPMEGGNVLLTPSNSTPYGSDHSGDAPDGAGKPPADGPTPDQNPSD